MFVCIVQICRDKRGNKWLMHEDGDRREGNNHPAAVAAVYTPPSTQPDSNEQLHHRKCSGLRPPLHIKGMRTFRRHPAWTVVNGTWCVYVTCVVSVCSQTPPPPGVLLGQPVTSEPGRHLCYYPQCQTDVGTEILKLIREQPPSAV